VPGLIDAHTRLAWKPTGATQRTSSEVAGASVYPDGLNARELAVLVNLGLSPLEAIRAATIHAAHLLGLERWSFDAR
jgi:imidazolonepropionase-like amidohydrolase